MDFEALGLSEQQITEVNKAIQSSADKVRTEYSTKLKLANDELSKYKPTSKTDAEKELETKQAEIEKKELEIAKKERQLQLRDKLTEKGLSPDIAKFLNVDDDMDKFVDEFSGTFNSMLVNNGYKPSTSNKNSKGITKDDFAKMNYMERSNLYDTNPELFKLLSR